jgi:magnesium chelatase subunit D
MSPFDPAWDSSPPAPEFCDPVLAASLLAIDPAGLGGLLIRSWSGPERDEFLARTAALFPPGTAFKKMPLNITEDRLLGGLDLAATLAAGRPIRTAGLLTQAAGGVLILAMAERLSPGTAARIAAAQDSTAIAILALDEGANQDEAPPAALTDRLAFTATSLPHDVPWPQPARLRAATAALPAITAAPELLAQICALATAFGVASLRAQLFTLRAARAAAALRGAATIEAQDLAAAARLILTPRATRIPQSESPPPPPEAQDEPQPDQTSDSEDPKPLEDKIDDPTQAALPADLLAALLAAAGPRRIARGAGASGATASLKRGRPVTTRRGALTGDARLAVLDTIRAAAPWQRLRAAPPGRIAVRAEDFHIKRFKEQPRRIAIFAVDASGSSALNRLAEAKGAIQLLLAECYIQRDEVALIAFRGTAAELLLPPTSALARVRRALAALPGGGPTPLAAGITAALKLADSERRRHNQPFLVLLTDGGANIGADGKPGRAAAAADALAAARIFAAQNIPALIVDTAPRKNPFAAQLAAAMRGRYLPLPYADSAGLSRAVQTFGASHARLAA